MKWLIVLLFPLLMQGQSRVMIPDAETFELSLPVGSDARSFSFEPFDIYAEGLELELNDRASGLALPKVYRAVGANVILTEFNGKVSVSGLFGENLLRMSPNGDYYYGPAMDEGPFCDNLPEHDLNQQPDEFRAQTVGTCILVDYHITESLYYDLDNDLDATIQYVTDLLAMSHLLYFNEGVTLKASALTFWTADNQWFDASYVSSYAGLDDASAYASANGYAGNGLHLLHLSTLGGVAYVGGFNPGSPATSVAFSGIRNTFSPYPAYSWSVMVIAHEMGHSCGSKHTHSCTWGINGNASIDRCGPNAGYTEGSCTAETSLYNDPPGGGSVMSYCHLRPVGMNLESGFLTGEPGSQWPVMPGDKVRSARDNWGFACVDACDGPINLTAIGTINSITVSWQGAGTFNVRLTPGNTVSGAVSPLTFTGLTPGASYQVSVQGECGEGVTTPWISITATTLCDVFIHAPDYVDDMSADNWQKGSGWAWNADGFYEVLPTATQSYPNNYNASITSPCFSTAGEEFGKVRVGVGGSCEPTWDKMVLEISTDNATWEKLGVYPDFYNYSNVYNNFGPAWSGTFPVDYLDVDLSDWIGAETMKFRFRFISDGVYGIGTGPEVTYFELFGPGSCDSIVYDTLTVEVFDTTEVITYDTLTVTVNDTIFTDVFDTTFITAYDTITVIDVITVYDTTFVTAYDTIYTEVFDTTYINCPDDECDLIAVIPGCHTLFTVGRPSITLETAISGGTPPYQYSWSTGIVLQNMDVTAPGIYQVTVTDAEGCEATASTEVTLIDNNCSGSPRPNKGWMCKGGQTYCVSASQIDNYLADGWTLGACYSDPCVVYENRTRLVSSDGLTYKLIIFPNPTSGHLMLLYDGDTKYMTIEVTDNLGRKVYSGPFTNDLEINGPAGAYTVTVMNRGYAVYSAVIVKY